MVNAADLREQLSRYSFYHVIELMPGVTTDGLVQYRPIQRAVSRILSSIDLRNKHVLDVGCRDGLFSFQAERQGADEIIAIDNDLSRGAREVLIPFLRSRVKMMECNILSPPASFNKSFDLVICAGVLYHLRTPFYALHVMRSLLRKGGLLLLETAIINDYGDRAILFCPSGDQSPYEPTSVSFFNYKGLIDTLNSFGFVVSETYPVKQRDISSKTRRLVLLCRQDDTPSSASLNEYWFGTHLNHSSGDDSHR